MRIASVVVEDIDGLSSLLVGMPECATHSRLFSPKPEGEHGELHWLYVLDAHEVVFGCRDGLMDALRKMDRAGAKTILLIATCVPDLIGEDIEGIVREVQSELSSKIAWVTLGQFKNTSYPPGSWKTMESLGALMDKKQTDPSRVNVLGRAPEEDHIPMPALLPELERRGISLRYIAPGASIADFQNAGDAALNLVVSPYTQPLAVKMERELGIPFISLHTLYAVKDIDRAYADIAERFSFSWDNAFRDERKEALMLEEQARKKLAGLTFALLPRIDVTLSLSLYLADLGMEPLLLHLEEFYPEDRDHAGKLILTGHNPWICRMVNPDADIPILEKLAPDLCFGYLPPDNKTIACVPEMFDFYGQTGYARTSSLIKRILGVLDEVGMPVKVRVTYGAAPV